MFPKTGLTPGYKGVITSLNMQTQSTHLTTCTNHVVKLCNRNWLVTAVNDYILQWRRSINREWCEWLRWNTLTLGVLLWVMWMTQVTRSDGGCSVVSNLDDAGNASWRWVFWYKKWEWQMWRTLTVATLLWVMRMMQVTRSENGRSVMSKVDDARWRWKFRYKKWEWQRWRTLTVVTL